MAVLRALSDASELAWRTDADEEDEDVEIFDWLACRRDVLARRPLLPASAIVVEGGPVTLDEPGGLHGGDATSLGTFTVRGDVLEVAGQVLPRRDDLFDLGPGRFTCRMLASASHLVQVAADPPLVARRAPVGSSASTDTASCPKVRWICMPLEPPVCWHPPVVPGSGPGGTPHLPSLDRRRKTPWGIPGPGGISAGRPTGHRASRSSWAWMRPRRSSSSSGGTWPASIR